MPWAKPCPYLEIGEIPPPNLQSCTVPLIAGSYEQWALGDVEP